MVQQMIADAAIDIHTSRLAIWHAAWVLDTGGDARQESSIAKTYVAEAVNRVVDHAIQICGSLGISGLTHGSVRDAVYRGALRAEQIARRSLIPAAEIERYRKEVQGTQGWEKRKEPSYTLNEKQRRYQQAYYPRRKAAHKQQPATEPAE